MEGDTKKSSNQNRCTIISRCKVGQMSLERHIRSGRHDGILIQAGLACVAVIAVLAARNAPYDFSKAPYIHSAISADSHYDKRPRFDDSRSKWIAPADSFQFIPPSAESVHLTQTPQPFSTLQTKGFHYNRPPPIS